METPTLPTPTPTPTTNYLERAADTVQSWTPALIALAVLALVVAIATPRLINQLIIWRESRGYTRFEAFLAPFKALYRLIYKLITKREAPRPWRLIQPRDLLKKKERLMNHPDIRAALTSSEEQSQWITDRDTYKQSVYGQNADGQKVFKGTETAYRKHKLDFKAWLSPYPGTVRTLCKYRPNYNSQTQRYLPREWVRIMASRVIIREATPKESLGLVKPKRGRDFFVIELYADHSTPDKLRKLEAPIKSALKLGDLREIDKDNPRRVTWLATMPGVKTPLANDYMPTGADFIKAHPASRDLSSVPLAVTITGDVWSVRPMHTLIVGVTGAGKSTPLNMLTAQLSDAVLAGTATITALDPKENGDLRFKWGRSAIYTACGTNPDDYMRLIDGFYESMQEQGRVLSQSMTQGATFTAADLSYTDFRASTKTPLRVLMIDEIPAVIEDLTKSAEGKASLKRLNRVLREGRSLGHIVIAATQSLDKKTLESINRENFVYKIALSIESEYQNGVMLGTEAAARGFNACDIPITIKTHEFTGVAYVKDSGGGDPIMLRFPFFPDAQIAEIMNRHAPAQQSAAPAVADTADEQAQVAPESLDDDLDDIDTL